MTYIPWSVYVEGPTDLQYFNVIIPKTIEHILAGSDGPISTIPDYPVHEFGIPRDNFDDLAVQICAGSESFTLFFIHGDTGGRKLASKISDRTCSLCEKIEETCAFPKNRCIVVTPNRETEAWTLADRSAIRTVFGLSNDKKLSKLPKNPKDVESITDPKIPIQDFLNELSTRKTRKNSKRWPFERIAQEQSVDLLLEVPSFKSFYVNVTMALKELGHPNV
ncbi:hypothetical protein [Vreelandella sp. GE22]